MKKLLTVLCMAACLFGLTITSFAAEETEDVNTSQVEGTRKTEDDTDSHQPQGTH